MTDPSAGTNQELFAEIASLKRRITELEASESERKRVETALRECEELHRITLENILDPVFITDSEGKFTFICPNVLHILGYSVDELRAMGHISACVGEGRSLFDPEDLNRWGKIANIEAVMTNKNGSKSDCLVTVKRVSIQGGAILYVCHDISERKQAEEKEAAIKKELQDAILFQQRLIDALPTPVFYKDSEGRYLGCNHAFEKFFGKEKGQISGKSVYDLSPKEIADIYHEKDLALLRNPGIQIYESVVKDAGGCVHNVIFHKDTFPNSDGSVGGLIGAVLDITERKRAEEERKAHIRFLESLERVDQAIKQEKDVEQMLRNIVQTVFSIFDCDRAWLLYPCDPDAPSFRVPVEITRPEYPGAKVLNADVPMSPGEAENMREALASDDPVTYTAGTERPVSTAKQFGVQSQMFMPVYPKLGSPWVFGMHQCSHPRIWTEEEKKLFTEIGRRISDGLSSVLFLRELQKNEERFRATFEQAAVGIAHVAPDGRWMRVNQKLCDIVGYSREELLRKKFQDITHPDDLDDDLECVRKALAEVIRTYNKEKRYIRKDGSIVWINLTVSIVHQASGEPGYLISVVEDITERKRAEEEIRLNEARLMSLLKISQYKAESIQELLDFALAEAITLTGSKIGYIYFYNAQTKEFTLNTWSKEVMNECAIAEPKTIYHLEKTGIWGEAVRQARPVLVNDFQAPHPLKKGYPEGHAPLYKYLTIPVFIAGRIVAVVAVANKPTDYDESDVRQLNLMMDSVWKIADGKRAEEQLRLALDNLRKSFSATVQVMVSAVETRDPYTAGHQNRSADLSRTIATEMGLPQERVDGIRMAGIIHDIGKLSVPAEILSKPTKLSELEFSLIKEHAGKGFEMLKDVESPWPLAEIVYQHHERMDGSGYPRHLKGEEILMEARILAVADVVESMASHRPYRPALGIDAALEEISRNRDILYDPEVTDTCLKLFREKGYRFVDVT